MKKGINVWTMPKEFSIKDQIELAEKAGYQTIELNVAEKHEKELDLSLETTEEELEEIKKLLDSANVKLESISTALHWEYPLTSNEGETREQGRNIVKKMIDFAKYLGAEVVLVVPGLVTSEVSYLSCYTRSMDALKQLAPYAESKKITIGIENVENLFLLSPLDARDFIDEIGSPFIQFYFDVGNALPFGYPEQWIQILDHRIKRIHVKDFKKEIGNLQGFCQLLAGDVDWEEVLLALRAIGYEGPLTCELSPYRFQGEQLAYDTSRALDLLLAYGES